MARLVQRGSLLGERGLSLSDLCLRTLELSSSRRQRGLPTLGLVDELSQGRGIDTWERSPAERAVEEVAKGEERWLEQKRSLGFGLAHTARMYSMVKRNASRATRDGTLEEGRGALQAAGGGKRRLKVKARSLGPSRSIAESRSFASATVGRSPRGTHHSASACPPTTAVSLANQRRRAA